jgi:predicted outer membrane protein
MSFPIRRLALSCMVLVLGVALVAAQQPARQPVRQPLQPGAGAQPRQPGQIGQQGQIRQGQVGQQGQITQQRQLGQPGQRGQLEQLLITLLIIENNKEISLGQIAEQTSKNDKVREFAQMIQKDHGNFVQKLQELSAASGSRGARLGSQSGDLVTEPGRAASATAATETRSDAKRDAPARDDQERERGQRDRSVAGAREDGQREGAGRHTVARPVIPNTPGSELLQYWQDVSEECVNSARKDAQQQSPEEFEKLFITAQLLAHKGMLDKLRIAERNASPQLAQVLRDAQGTTKQHLEHAEQLHADLGSGERREGSAIRERSKQREGASERRERQEQ